MSMNANWIFVDMNSYFASVEQQMQPRLRNRPMAVVPVLAESSCCIAASYEAKQFGVKTGTSLREARQRCPDIVFVLARTEQYVQFHKRIVQAVESVLPVTQVHSIDEMSCQLRGPDRPLDQAERLARQIKTAIRQQVGSCLRCSVGIAPNRMLAKLASDMQKPDGLTILRREDLPGSLYRLKLDDFAGIGPRMLLRFQRAGVRTVEQMCQLPAHRLKDIWGGVIGERWWHLLRGEDLLDKPTQRRTVGHSHVLPPEYRNDPLAYEVLIKLIHKAAIRLREMKYFAGQLTIRVVYQGHWDWHETCRLGDINDTQTMLDAAAEMWTRRPDRAVPFKLEITLHHLKSSRSCAPSLFPEQRKRQTISRAMDLVNQQLGDGAIYLAAMHQARASAPERIAFQSIPECRPTHPSQHQPSFPHEGFH